MPMGRRRNNAEKAAPLAAKDESSGSTIATASGNAAGAAFSGAQYLMGLQLFVKLASFAINAIIIYLTDEKAFGVASIHFELLLSTIIFLSREGMRNALLRVDATTNSSTTNSQGVPEINRRRPSRRDQLIINASLIPIVAGMAMAGLAYFVNAQSTQSTDAESGDIEMPYYRLSLTVYIVAAWVELCVEPLFVLSRVRVMFKMQAQCEAISVAGRCLAIIIVLFAGRYLYVSDSGANPFSLIAFAIGQMTYAVLILVTYAWRMSQELEYPVQLCYTPRPVALAEDSSAEGQGYIGGAIGSLAMTFVGQSLLKHFLTQGDNIVMSNFATPSDMGTFAVVTNYGSIPARVIFLPLEEASRAMFSKMVGKQSKTPERADRSGSDAAVEQADAELASHVLSTLGKFQFLLGSILMVFGTLYSPTLLSLLGKNDAALSQSLIAYCLYLPLMGLNGFLEAFVHSVASRSQLFQVNIAMVAFTAIYALFSIQMLSTFKLGSLGIVVANMLNMALRIGYCKRFVTQWFTKCNVRSPRFAAMLPHPAVLAMCTLSGVVVVLAQSAIGQDTLVQRLGALAVGGAMGICVLAAIWRYEREFVESILELRSGKLLKRKTE